jgi:hypothetical protein
MPFAEAFVEDPPIWRFIMAATSCAFPCCALGATASAAAAAAAAAGLVEIAAIAA